MLSRRAILALPFAAACSRPAAARFAGYAFVANEEGQAIAAVDLGALVVARHIPLDAAPSQVLASGTRPAVYALTPSTGSIHQIDFSRLAFVRKSTVASTALSMRMSRDGRSLYVLSRQPKALLRLGLDDLRVNWRIDLPAEPVDFDIAYGEKTAAVSLESGVHFIDIPKTKLGDPMASGDIGSVRFLKDGERLIVANRGEKKISVYETASSKLLTHLPVAVRPDHLCFTRDWGQIYITGEGMDGVVIVYPYHTPEVAQTLLAGHAPGAMAASESYVFIASPQSGDVSILRISTQKVIAVVPVGSDPGFVVITPDDQFALVLNRKSGDVAVLRIGAIAEHRYKNRAAALLTIIPVGSRPVSADVRSV